MNQALKVHESFKRLTDRQTEIRERSIFGPCKPTIYEIIKKYLTSLTVFL